MATIRELPSGKVNVQVRREGHPPLTATFPNRTEATAWPGRSRVTSIRASIVTGRATSKDNIVLRYLQNARARAPNAEAGILRSAFGFLR